VVTATPGKPVDFLHLSDVHLGYQQYGYRERFNDFGRAFLAVVDYAVQHEVGFVVISGDFFHRSAVDPPTLLQAVSGLDRLRQVQIPVVAVAGNHDRARYRDRFSWLDFLSERGYLYLLSPTFEEAGISLLPWDGSQGAYVDIGGVRVYGIPYLGASIRPVLAELPRVLTGHEKDGIEFTVLAGHFGLEGEMPGVPGGLQHNEVAPLKEYVDYLALGHWHKPFEREGWIYNPGSLETCAMDERRWHGGFYHVTVDTRHTPKYQAQHVKSRRRPFHRLPFQVDEYATPQALYDGLHSRLKDAAPQMNVSDLAPVVEISLEGILAFDRGDLDLEYVRKLTEEIASPLIVKVKNNTRSTEFEIAPDIALNRTDLERTVLKDLLMRDARYREQAEEWAAVAVEVKRMVLTGSAPESIAAAVRRQLVDAEQE